MYVFVRTCMMCIRVALMLGAVSGGGGGGVSSQQEASIQLERKDKEANEKLNHMLVDQREAEQKREASVKISAEVEQQQKVITERKIEVETQLSEAGPALEAAKESLNSVTNRQLGEVASYATPPKMVKLGVEPVAIVMGVDVKNWKNVKKMLKGAHFIRDVMNFNADRITNKMRKLVSVHSTVAGL